MKQLTKKVSFLCLYVLILTTFTTVFELVLPSLNISAQESQEQILYGETEGHGGLLQVEVTVLDNQIIDVSIVEHSETEGISDIAIERIPQQIVEQQSTMVEAVSGATLTSDAILIAVIAALDSGGITLGDQDAEAQEAESGETIHLETEVVVVGGGAAGLSASVAAAEKGANVILLEKMPQLGGTSNYAEGVFGVESQLQHNDHIDTTQDEAFRFIMEYSHWLANPKIARAFVDKSGDTIDWLQTHGVEFVDVTTNNPGGLRTWHIFDGFGAGMITAMSNAASEVGVDVHLETTGQELIVDENNNIAGIIAVDKDNNRLEIQADAVIIASGGYANNDEWIQRYTEFDNIAPVGNAGKMGEGIQMAWDVGANERGIEVLQLYRPGIPGEASDSHLNAAARQPYLWVNNNGERFADETVVFLWPFAGNALSQQPNAEMFTVFDNNTKDYMMNQGLDSGVGVIIQTGTKLVNLEEDLQRGMENGDVFVADTIEDLAGQIGMNPNVLNETILNYNLAYDSNYDGEFNKDMK